MERVGGPLGGRPGVDRAAARADRPGAHRRARLLLLDEPHRGMGAREIEKIEEIIRRSATRGVTVVVVSHDVKMLMNLSDCGDGAQLRPEDRGGHAGRGAEGPPVLEAYLGTE